MLCAPLLTNSIAVPLHNVTSAVSGEAARNSILPQLADSFLKSASKPWEGTLRCAWGISLCAPALLAYKALFDTVLAEVDIVLYGIQWAPQIADYLRTNISHYTHIVSELVADDIVITLLEDIHTLINIGVHSETVCCTLAIQIVGADSGKAPYDRSSLRPTWRWDSNRYNARPSRVYTEASRPKL